MHQLLLSSDICAEVMLKRLPEEQLAELMTWLIRCIWEKNTVVNVDVLTAESLLMRCYHLLPVRFINTRLVA